ncbi:MAG: tRNA lysidine(34) synthetase TilS [Dehalococcoidia bacterium]|nr:tRNA lysidine(34) synthetase TilS [Dehalococcoidia bacterium]
MRKDRLAETVRRFILQNRLVEPGEKVVVGVSGGADSICLLHILFRLRQRLGITLHVAHLNHLLRGAESDSDAKYVSGVAHRLGVPATVESRDVKTYQSAHRLSLEDAARQVRYQFFAQVVQEVGAGRVAVGHTVDDQAETILMHLIRGAGPAGLLGMRALTAWKSPGVEGLTVIRPLLSVSREETQAYCRRRRLVPHEDSSNLSLSAFRNRVRQELVPLLQAYNPRISEALARMSDTLAMEQDFIEDCVSEIWPQVTSEEDGAITLERKSVVMLHPAVQRHLLRRVVRQVVGDLEDIEWKHIEQMRDGLGLRKGKKLLLPRGLSFSVAGRTIRVSVD